MDQFEEVTKMSYPANYDFGKLGSIITDYGKLMCEYGARCVDDIIKNAYSRLIDSMNELKNLEIDKVIAVREPDELGAIKNLRPEGPRRVWKKIDNNVYLEKLEGAMLARFAGCTLGAPVEFWSIEAMEKWAAYLGFAFPPKDYWPKIKAPNDLRYGVSPCEAYTSEKMNTVPVDDDITYTILGLLIAEDYGINFTTDDVGKAWLKYLPYACTAEEVALANLKKGIPAKNAADVDNPYCQWIGADIRSDPWAYMAPGWPEKAAELAYRDAYLSHRRNGIYGEMFFAAVQSAAFAVDNAMDALKTGLTEIPGECSLYKDILWSLEEVKNIHSYKDARQAVDEKFAGMSGVHTNINAALTVFGLIIGGNDVTRVISEVVAMGMDNDCTAATAGSIVGAIVGKKNIPAHWYSRFNDKVLTYLKGAEDQHISDLVHRFAVLAGKVFS
jgi:ADP-ribosylglycohydrolase